MIIKTEDLLPVCWYVDYDGIRFCSELQYVVDKNGIDCVVVSWDHEPTTRKIHEIFTTEIDAYKYAINNDGYDIPADKTDLRNELLELEKRHGK
jgi:hypothetical protein